MKKICASSLIAFWVLMTNHCGWERIPGLKFLACSPLAEAAPHQPSDCGGDDACATVESGQYRSEESQVSAPKASIVYGVFALAVLSDLAALERFVPPVSLEVTPPEFAHTWQFSFRTALPPRAPSLLS